MAEFFEWTESEFGVHVKAMDDEHKQLISFMNKLHHTWQSKGTFNEVLSCVDNLAQYTIKHFKDEEAYMEQIKWEGLPTHKIIHAQLLKQFTEYVDDFKKTQVLNEKFFNFLKVWLSSHIRGIDEKYGKFATTKKAA